MTNRNTIFTATGQEALQSRFGLRVAARLNETTRDLPHDVTERLRAGREQALERARLARKTQAASNAQMVGNGPTAALTLGGPGSHRWLKLASLLPLIALVGGFLLIEHVHVKEQITAAAEVDAALLADDLPPAAYGDPGFVEFLKSPRD